MIAGTWRALNRRWRISKRVFGSTTHANILGARALDCDRESGKLIVKCPKCSAVVDVSADGADALAGGYKLFCPVIREKVIKRELFRQLECPHMRDASDAETKRLKHG